MSHDAAADELLRQIESSDAPLVLDVRSRAEFDAGHVPGSVNLPFWVIPFRASSLAVKPDEPIGSLADAWLHASRVPYRPLGGVAEARPAGREVALRAA